MENKTGFIRIQELTTNGTTTNGTNFKCATCDNNITELRAMKFPICDECIKDLREIIAERRKPNVVEIGQTNQGGENG